MTDADKPAFLQAMARLAVALRDKAPDVVTMKTYFEALRPLEIELIVAAAERMATTAEWFPKVPEWCAAVVTITAEKVEAQQAYLRSRPVPVCPACQDTGWAGEADGRNVRRCDCRETRWLELLGRRPWPALPASTATKSEVR